MASSPESRDVAAAAWRLGNAACLTPLLELPGLAPRDSLVAVKAECLQVGGAFKFRGAFNRLVQLDADARARGVVAFSSGNHAQGVALAGRRLGIPTTIVMPADAPRVKLERTRAFGAEVVLYDRFTESREAIAAELAAERGATLVPSFDDPDIIAGQGTVGLELVRQSEQQFGRRPDVLLVPCGGGGLIAGCALALELASPGTLIYSVEPQGFDDTARSLASRAVESIAPGASTLCDALRAPTPGRLTLPINRRRLAGGLVVTDDMVLAAMRLAWSELRLVVEPGGAVALAAALHGLVDLAGRFTVIVLSGGNVDAALYSRALA